MKIFGFTKKLVQINTIDCISGICVSISLSIMLCLFAPYDIYISNRSEFWFSQSQLLALSAIIFMIFVLINVFVLFCASIISKVLYRITVIIEFCSLITLYIHGNFLSYNLPGLNGEPVNWDDYKYNMLLSVFIVMLIFTILIFLINKAGCAATMRIVSICSAGLLLMLLLTMSIEAVLYNTSAEMSSVSWVATEDNLFGMSDDKNMIILLLDYTDGEEFNNLLLSEKEYREVFDGFTSYTDAMGMYSYTRYSIPTILSGERYEFQENYTDYLSRIMNDSPLLCKMEQENYNMCFYEKQTILPYNDKDVFKFRNVKPSSESTVDFYKFFDAWANLVCFKYMPYQFKSMFQVLPGTFSETQTITSTENVFKWDDVDFYNNCISTPVTIKDQKQFKFIHLEGAHEPFHLVNMKEERGDYADMLKSCLMLVERYLEKLKEYDVYDNSVIVIMADHGAGIDVDKMVDIGGNPILFIKGIGEHHELSFSDIPVSWMDLQSMFNNLADGKLSNECTDINANVRERYFLYQKSALQAYEPFIEYASIGRASDTSSYYKTGNEYIYKSFDEGKYYVQGGGRILFYKADDNTPSLIEESDRLYFTLESDGHYLISDCDKKLYLTLDQGDDGTYQLSFREKSGDDNQKWTISPVENKYRIMQGECALSYDYVDGHIFGEKRYNPAAENQKWIISSTKMKSKPEQYAKWVVLNNQDSGKKYISDIHEAQRIDDYLDQLVKNKQELNIYIAVSDIPGIMLSLETIDKLVQLGCQDAQVLLDKDYHSYIAVINNGNLYYEHVGPDERYEWNPEDLNIKIISSTYGHGGKAAIEIDGDQYAINTRGINIVVQDALTEKIIDSVAFDTYLYDRAPVIR